MTSKKTLTLSDIVGKQNGITQIKQVAENDEALRGSVQTVRMDRETLKKLKYASIERGISQNDIMLRAIRRDLGME